MKILIFIGVVAWMVLSIPANVSAAGDAVQGKLLYESRCVACHSVDENRVGPAHNGVFGRKAGSVPGYPYSAAVNASNIIWTEKNLDLWLANPERLVPGQKMGYSVTDAQDRADLIAFLKAISAQPCSAGSRAAKRSCRSSAQRAAGSMSLKTTNSPSPQVLQHSITPR